MQIILENGHGCDVLSPGLDVMRGVVKRIGVNGCVNATSKRRQALHSELTR